MKVEYIRETGGNYMEIKGNDGKDCFEMKMIRNNNINGLLPLTVRQVNAEYRYLYKINSHVNIVEFYDRQGMRIEDLEQLILALKNMLNTLSEYMLDEAGLILQPEYVFRDNSEGIFKFAYFAKENQDFTEGLRKLFEGILGIIDHNDNEVVTVAYGIYKRLCLGECSIDELFTYERKKECKECEVVTIEKENTSVIPEIVYEEEETTDKIKLYGFYGVVGCVGIMFLVGLLFLLSDSMRPIKLPRSVCGLVCITCGIAGYLLYKWYIENKDTMVKIATKETVIPYTNEKVNIILPEVKEDNLTTVLNREEVSECTLEWQEKGIFKKYVIRENTLIGSQFGKVDCVVSLPGVSRVHAKIIRENEKYYVKDMNSTNGTMVNDIPLASYQLTEIKRNDVLSVGNVKLMFN